MQDAQFLLQQGHVDALYLAPHSNKAFQVYEQWLRKTRPAPGPDGLRRPLWFARAVRPAHEAYRLHACLLTCL